MGRKLAETNLFYGRRGFTVVQAAYENNDSILVVPISTDHLRSMKIIGQTIAIDVIMHSKNTMFF